MYIVGIFVGDLMVIYQIYVKHLGVYVGNLSEALQVRASEFGIVFARKLVLSCLKLYQKILEIEVALCYKFAEILGFFVTTILWNVCVYILGRVPLGEQSSCMVGIVHYDCTEFGLKKKKNPNAFQMDSGCKWFQSTLVCHS